MGTDGWKYENGSFNEFGFLDVRHAFIPPLEFLAAKPVARLQQGF
jgi:hypothetical protein